MALSERATPRRNVHVIVGVCFLLVALTLLCGAMLGGSFMRERGCLIIGRRRRVRRPLSPTSASSTLSLIRSGALPGPSHTHAQSYPHRILLLYSRDSFELCDCMEALAKVLSVATHAEVLDPLNGSWGAGLEMHRDAGLTQWLYAVLRHNCSVLLLMTPGGQVRQNAIDQLEKVTFDPPHMLDDIFLLGFNYIKVQKASDYAKVFQISLEGVGHTGETYNVGVSLAKYILPARLDHLICTLKGDELRLGHQDLAGESYHFYGCDEYGYRIRRFKRSLEDLKILYRSDPQYMDRAIVSTSDMSSVKA